MRVYEYQIRDDRVASIPQVQAPTAPPLPKASIQRSPSIPDRTEILFSLRDCEKPAFRDRELNNYSPGRSDDAPDLCVGLAGNADVGA